MLTVMPDRPANSPANPPTILLDCDPGHDDAIAIVAAAHTANLVGITTVAGNAPLSATTRNALVMRDLLGLNVPVHSGATRPLIAEPKDAGHVHGSDGFGGVNLPEPTTPLDGTNAVQFIIDTCRANDHVWLVPVGPLTNIALALRLAPDIADRVAGVSLMGGGTFGNRSALTEFNIWADPEAARIVFESGAPLTMAGLDVTYQFLATPERIGVIRDAGGVLGHALAELLSSYSAAYETTHDDDAYAGAAVHDPLAVLAVTRPDLFERSRCHVAVETAGELTRGMTVIDQRRIVDRPKPNCDVLTAVDAHGAFSVILEGIQRFVG